MKMKRVVVKSVNGIPGVKGVDEGIRVTGLESTEEGPHVAD